MSPNYWKNYIIDTLKKKFIQMEENVKNLMSPNYRKNNVENRSRSIAIMKCRS